MKKRSALTSILIIGIPLILAGFQNCAPPAGETTAQMTDDEAGEYWALEGHATNALTGTGTATPQAFPEEGPYISGYVLDSNDQPISGVTVILAGVGKDLDKVKPAVQTTDANGLYTFLNVVAYKKFRKFEDKCYRPRNPKCKQFEVSVVAVSKLYKLTPRDGGDLSSKKKLSWSTEEIHNGLAMSYEYADFVATPK